MDALIARTQALGTPSSSKGRKRTHGHSKPPSSKPHESDPVLTSIAKTTRVPNSLAHPAEKDPALLSARKKSFGHVKDLKLRAHLAHLAEHSAQVKEMRDDAEMLGTTQAGAMEVEGEMERTWKTTQSEVKESVGVEAGKACREWVLDGGAYVGRYSRNGRHLAIAGKKGHVATFDWQTGTLHSELQLRETVRDVTFLQDQTLYAVAQSKHVYMYDLNGVELHRLSNHIEPTKLEFLPYHWLLVSVGNPGVLVYQDVSTGQTICEHRTRLGACRAMCQNWHNAVIQLGHQNGTVTLWTPNSSKPHVRLLAHMGPVTSISMDPSSAGRYIATSGMDGTVKVWDSRNWKGCVRKWNTRASTAEVEWSQRGMLGVACGGSVNVYNKPAITQPHLHAAPPPLYMTHPIPHRPLSSIRFCPFQDTLTVGHSAGLSSLLVPGAGEANFDSAEADPFEGRNARREREVRALLDKLAPDTIVLDPDIIGGMAESAQPGLGAEGVVEVYRRLPRLERLRVSGKADESQVIDPLDAKVDEEESGEEGLNGLGEKEKKVKREERKKRMRMRGKDKSMKRFVKKKRENILDPATIAIRAKLEKQRAEQAKRDAAKAKGASAATENEGSRSALDRFRR